MPASSAAAPLPARLLLALPALAWSGLACAQAATPPARPAKLGQCVACHGDHGRSRIPGTPHLAGQDALYLERALAAYRSGTRRSAPMNAIAGTLQPRDIRALARWYASRPAGAR